MKIFAVAAYLAGLGGLGVLLARIVLTGLEVWPEPEATAWPNPWLIDLGWLIVFAIPHSGMARSGFKDWLGRWFPAELERSLYVACSGLVTLALTLTWQTIPGQPLWRGPIWLLAIAGVGAGIMIWCGLGYHHLGFMGLSQAWRQPLADALQTSGLYRFVRHPLMFGTLLILWSQPTMTPTLALLSGGLTSYIFLALPLEERELARKFGPAYEAYRRRVPALIPWRW